MTTFFPPYNFGGDGIFVYRLANALARRGHKIDVIHDIDAYNLSGQPPAEASYPLHENIRLHSLSQQSWGKLDLLASHQAGRPLLKRARIKAILEAGEFDVIHFHNISLLGGPGVLRYGQAIKLCTMHDHWFVCAMHVMWRFDQAACTRRTCLACTLHGRRPPQLWRYSGMVRRAASAIDAFITPSKFARQNHLDNGFPAPIHVLPYFIADQNPPDPASASSARDYFLYVGRLEKLKGVQYLIDVFRKYQAADLIIAGSGSYESILRKQAEGLEHIHFTGFLDHTRLLELYVNSIAVIVPSLTYETFGWISLEAFTTRTPAIVHDIGALPEIVKSGGGIVYQTGDELVAAMESLRTQPDLREQVGEAGYLNYRQNYTEDRHIEQYFALIDELQAKRQPQMR